MSKKMAKQSDDLMGYPGMSKAEAEAVWKRRVIANRWKTVPKIPRGSQGVALAPIASVSPSGIPVPKRGLKVAYIPDTQCRDGVNMNHLTWAGEYIERKRPDVIVHAGDHWDMPSLNEHNTIVERVHSKRTYLKDIDAGKRGMELLLNPIAKARGYKPYQVFTMGNHCYRIIRALMADPRLEGIMSLDHLCLEDYGWTVYPFLEPVEIGGTAFSHYFPSGVRGQPICTARQLLQKYHMSAIAGHQQHRDIAFGKRADGRSMTALITGSFYQHDEEYLSPFTNKHWRGMYMFHEMIDGEFDEMAVSINFLRRKFKENRGR